MFRLITFYVAAIWLSNSSAAIAAMFNVTRGNCIVTSNFNQDCVQSDNFGVGAYSVLSTCRITVNVGGRLTVAAFDTQKTSDKLSITSSYSELNYGVDFSGKEGPSGVIVLAGDEMRWVTTTLLFNMSF